MPPIRDLQIVESLRAAPAAQPSRSASYCRLSVPLAWRTLVRSTPTFRQLMQLDLIKDQSTFLGWIDVAVEKLATEP